MFPPGHTHKDVQRVKRILTNTTRFLKSELSAADADDDAKADFLDGAIRHAPFAERLEPAVKKDPALADLTNDKGERAIDLACLECRRAMQRALFLLNRYDVDKTPPLHFSATAAVLGATDYGDDDINSRQRYALKAMRDLSAVLAELKGRTGLESKFVVAVVGVYVNKGAEGVDQIEKAIDELKTVNKLGNEFVVDTSADLGSLSGESGLLAQLARSEGDDASKAKKDEAATQRFKGYKYVVVLELADETLSRALTHGGIAAADFLQIRRITRDLALALDHLHSENRIHADLKPLNVLRVGTSWQLIDLDVSCAIGEQFGEKKPSSGYCPPEMARVLLKATTKDGDLDKSELGTYTADVAYDLWSLGVVLFHLMTGTPLWKTDNHDDVSTRDLEKLAAWTSRQAATEFGRAVLYPSDDQRSALDLIAKLLEPDSTLRLENFRDMQAVKAHAFVDTGSLVGTKLEALKKQGDEILVGVNAVRALSEEHRDELRRTREVLLKAVFEATEVSTPTAFVILKEKLATKEELRKKPKNFALKLRDDGTGIDAEGTFVDEVEGRFKEAETWTRILAKLSRGLAKCSPSEITAAVQKACEELVVKEEMFLYLIDELTLEPVRPQKDGEKYPIRITKPADIVATLLPVMQVGLHAASLVNGVSGVAKLFGFPLPSVPETWREGAQKSVEILKQESSVKAFGAVHKNVQAGDEKNELDLRGKGLRELKKFFEKEDKDGDYAGLRRIGDDDGLAVWTALTDPTKVKKALESRAEERRKETTHQEALLSGFLETSEDPAAEKPTDEQVREEAAAPAPGVLGASKDKEDPAAAPPVSQEIAAVKATLDDVQERLKNLETAKAEGANPCSKCTIA